MTTTALLNALATAENRNTVGLLYSLAELYSIPTTLLTINYITPDVPSYISLTTTIDKHMPGLYSSLSNLALFKKALTAMLADVEETWKAQTMEYRRRSACQ